MGNENQLLLSIKNQIESRKLFTKEEISRIFGTDINKVNIKMSVYYEYKWEDSEYTVDIGYYKDDKVIGIATVSYADESGTFHRISERQRNQIANKIIDFASEAMSTNGVRYTNKNVWDTEYFGVIHILAEFKNIDFIEDKPKTISRSLQKTLKTMGDEPFGTTFYFERAIVKKKREDYGFSGNLPIYWVKAKPEYPKIEEKGYWGRWTEPRSSKNEVSERFAEIVPTFGKLLKVEHGEDDYHRDPLFT